MNPQNTPRHSEALPKNLPEMSIVKTQFFEILVKNVKTPRHSERSEESTKKLHVISSVVEKPSLKSVQSA